MAKSLRVTGDALKREFSIEPKFDLEKRTVELSFSSEFAADRGGYMEVLSHDPKDVDLSRLNNSHPLLLNHDPEKMIGVVESARIDPDKKGRALVRFSKSQLAEEIWKDCVDGIRRLVSVGYRRTEELSSELVDGRELVRFAWTPHEISIVSVPFDAGVGIGRELPTPPEEKRILIVSEDNKNTPAPVDYQKEAKEILAIANNLGSRGIANGHQLAAEAISQGKTLAEFRALVIDKLPEVKPLEKPVLADVPKREWQKYSITRAINAKIEGRNLDGFEGEMHQELTKQLGRGATGFWLPSEALVPQSRSFVAGTDTLGGMLIETSNLGDQFIELLRSKVVCGQMGARVLNLQNPVVISQQNAAGGTNWVAGTAAATLSTGNFTQITLSPKVLTAFQQYDKQLLATGNPSIDSLIRDDITSIIALEIDKVALAGGGTSEPAGILATNGINTVAAGTNGLNITGSTLAFPFLVSMESEVAADNADQGSLGYVFHAKERGKLKTTPKFASTGDAIWEPGNTVNGYKTAISNQLARNLTTGTATTICGVCVFGNWSDLMLAQFAGGATDLVVDPYVLAVNGVVRLIARKWVDVGVRHPVSFCAGGGIIA